MELTIQVNPVERTVRLREVRALAAGDSCSVVLEGVRGADVSALRLALYRDAASDSPVASCPSFAPVRGHPNLATGDLRLDTTEMAAWFEAVRPEPEGSATDRDGSRSGDTAERAVRTDGWLVVSEPTRTWAACRVPVVLRPGAGVSGVVDPTSIQALVEGLVSASMSEALETKADLVDGKVPIEQLPSFRGSVLEYDAVSAFPTVGESGKIYVAKDTNKTYRWDVTQYVEISKSLALGETAETAYPGDKGKAATEKANAAYSAAESLTDGVNSLAGTIGTHIRDTKNPHKVTAAQVGAVPLVEDSSGAKTAVTIGSHKGRVGISSLANGNDVIASGYHSHAEGYNTASPGSYSHAEGRETTASGDYSHTAGFRSQTKVNDNFAYSWNGDGTRTEPYFSHGKGTYNINPVGGTSGFYIGEKKLSEVISDGVANKADKATTLAGYGITDAATKSELDSVNQNAANAVFGVQSELSTKADLVDGKVPANQLPSYVDDVLEFADKAAFPAAEQAEAGKIYVDRGTNRTYRWGGTDYVEISPSLALGETATTAYPGDKGKAAADLAASTSRRLDGYQAQYDSHLLNTSNPHSVTAEQVNAYTKTDVDAKLVKKADKATTLAGYGITDAATKTELNAKADKSALNAKADKSTTLAGYGITDAATKTELNALAAKVDAANAALEEVA